MLSQRAENLYPVTGSYPTSISGGAGGVSWTVGQPQPQQQQPQQPLQNQKNQNQWFPGQSNTGSTGGYTGQRAGQQTTTMPPPTSGYGSFDIPAQPTPQPTQQAAQVPATTQPTAQPVQQSGQWGTSMQGAQQPSQQFSINWGGATSTANRISGYESKIKALEERMRTAPRTPQETAKMNQNLANWRALVESQKQQLMNMGGGAAEFFQDNQQGLSDFFGAARQQYQTGAYAPQLNADQDMLWNLLSQGAQSWQPQQAPAWQSTPWQQW